MLLRCFWYQLQTQKQEREKCQGKLLLLQTRKMKKRKFLVKQLMIIDALNGM